MQLSRRDLLKLGLFGSAALLLPAERAARTALAEANRIPESRLPAPFTAPFTTPPVLAPVRSDAISDYYVITQQPASVAIMPLLTKARTMRSSRSTSTKLPRVNSRPR